jgi:hypothetical protein
MHKYLYLLPLMLSLVFYVWFIVAAFSTIGSFVISYSITQSHVLIVLALVFIPWLVGLFTGLGISVFIIKHVNKV